MRTLTHTFSTTLLHVVATDALFLKREVTSTLSLPIDNRPVDSADELSSSDFPAAIILFVTRG
jgi:hypothetical protein